ncbi:hypothetical protein SCHPADRAFT_946784 [Schizopora paradoxa]|uniref:Cupredoxin n=1 Tax=Schizopora paradoxa TaxID=27342 RepID=A0A0H2RL97_9AGAM|nr:hypothetical protein SCHPADRAFT_946784 [Schizopora paradoxa]
MYFATTLTSLALVGAAAAQNVINVTVGGTGNNLFIFSPSSVTANNGDVVQFIYAGMPGNHSVTQSSFANPCNPLSDGFDSGNILVPAGLPTTTSFPTWNLTITNQSQPIWFFCKQTLPGPHCSSGMVGSINAPTSGTNTFANFQAAAEKFQGIPPQNVGFLVGEGASASAAPGPLTGSFSGFGLPTLTTPASGAATGTSSTSAAGSTTTSSAAALNMKASTGLTVILAAVFGVAFA